VAIPVVLPGLRDQVLLQRRELEDLVAPLLAPTTAALARVVASAGLRPDQPDAVLLVGGASRMPLVAREVGMALGRPVAIDAHPKHPVALGAALVARTRAPAPARVAAPAAAGPAFHGPPPVGPPTATSVTIPAPPRWDAPRPGPTGPPIRVGPPGPGGPPVRPRPPASPGRGRWLVAALALVVLVAAVVIVASRSGDDDGGERSTVGTTDVTGPGDEEEPAAQPTAGASLAWTAELGEETTGAAVTDGQRVYIEDSTGRLTALDMASGTVAWAAVVGTEGSGVTPVLAGDAILASDTAEPYAIQALDAATGAVRWTVTDQWFYEQPVVVGDTVVVSKGYEVLALALADGSERWLTEMDDDTLWTGLTPAGDVLVAGTSNGHVVGLDAATGDVRFRTPMPRGDKTIWSVGVVGDVVLAYDDDAYVTALSAASGEQLWTLDAGASFPGSIAALGTDAAVWLDTNELLIVDPASGTERRRLPGGAVAMVGLPGDQPRLVVAGPQALVALETDGTEAWSAELPLSASNVTFGAGILVVTDFEGNVAAYRVAA
jgi:outer membrane protein assembly factor BamB